MLNSMTGYGKGAATSNMFAVTVEIRTVNHRFSDISIKAPRYLVPLENDIRKAVSSEIKRGKIDIFFQIEQQGDTGMGPELNRPVADSYLKLFRQMTEEYGLVGDVSLELLVAQKDVITTREIDIEKSDLAHLAMQALNAALQALQQMRAREGEAMQKDIVSRFGNLRGMLLDVEKRAPGVVTEWQIKLKERLARLPDDVSVDPQRITQEIAVFADRCDISEELARFASHLDQSESVLESDEPIGRKMDFIVQELNREANTMGSKSNDSELTQIVVEIKAELEKIREQIQNIE
ncbi:MAG: YicC family protein [Desulfuromonas sp.]|nr:MAG: YicC family protein [Desulfuromonas sp.]